MYTTSFSTQLCEIEKKAKAVFTAYRLLFIATAHVDTSNRPPLLFRPILVPKHQDFFLPLPRCVVLLVPDQSLSKDEKPSYSSAAEHIRSAVVSITGLNTAVIPNIFCFR